MTGPTPDERPDLALNGFADQDAFADFYRQTSAALHGYIAKVTGDSSVADDISQMAYLRLLKAPPMGDGHRRSYLYRAASSIMVDRWRSLDREQSRSFRDPPSESYAADREQSIDLRRLLEQLDGKERALLWLAYAEGFAHEEIADILGIARKSVKVMLFRVREKAKKMLGQRVDREPRD
jgi:RNA polymerase sigma-70 factor (ECF subfamily)